MWSRSLRLAQRLQSSPPSSSPGRTHVLLLHHGQPRTQFYAKEFLSQSSSLYYRVPLPVSRFMVNNAWSSFSTVHKAVESQGEKETGVFEKAAKTLSAEVESSLDELLPEFRPFRVSTAYLFQSPSIQDALEGVVREGVDRVILVPLYPHFSCWKSGALLNTAAGYLHKRTVRLSQDGPRRDEALRADIRGTGASFRLSSIHRWVSHPLLVQFWAQEISELSSDFDALLFVAPIERGYGSFDYERSVWAANERIAEAVKGRDGEAYGRSLPWLQAWYNGWDGWPLWGGCSRPSISSQLKRLRENGAQRVLVVPSTFFLADAHFDLLSVLPELLSKEEKLRLLTPSASSRPLLVHGFSEIIKNHLLGRENAQLRLYCKNCRLKECQPTRLLLTSPSS